MKKKTLGERGICTKFIAPALAAAGWDVQTQVRQMKAEIALSRIRVVDLLQTIFQ